MDRFPSLQHVGEEADRGGATKLAGNSVLNEWRHDLAQVATQDDHAEVSQATTGCCDRPKQHR
jgi:hypothetical protein